MIRITITVQEQKLLFESQGHAGGTKGQDLVCAAVSVLTQTLGLFLKKEKLLQKEIVEEGFLLLETVSLNEQVKSSVDMTLTGLETLRNQYPEKIEIIYKQI